MSEILKSDIKCQININAILNVIIIISMIKRSMLCTFYRVFCASNFIAM